jgi:hypothetical protein
MQLSPRTAFEAVAKADIVLLNATGYDAAGQPAVLAIEYEQHAADNDQRQGRDENQISG